MSTIRCETLELMPYERNYETQTWSSQDIVEFRATRTSVKRLFDDISDIKTVQARHKEWLGDHEARIDTIERDDITALRREVAEWRLTNA